MSEASNKATNVFLGPAFTSGTVPVRHSGPQVVDLAALMNEPEDAKLTGGTRSLDRRLLALNLGPTTRFGVTTQRTSASSRATAA